VYKAANQEHLLKCFNRHLNERANKETVEFIPPQVPSAALVYSGWHLPAVQTVLDRVSSYVHS